MKKPLRKIGVTDHAIVRYLERVHELDIEALKREIITQDIRKQIAITNSNTGVFHTKTLKPFQAIIEKGSIVTII